ncbi:hypothetical protein DL98DRAFT_474743 [Cadophora sp. DSE1049]|nr:hypothetical protein DL98DRAFT_474743 [Cadophora sp. DSE1049]
MPSSRTRIPRRVQLIFFPTLYNPGQEPNMKTSFRSVQNVFAVVGAALALSPLVTAAANSTNSTSDFVVGAGRVDITPVISPNWLPLNEFELEKLHVRAIVFQNDGVRGAIVSCEVVSLDDPVMQSAIALLAAELDTPASNILFSVTHTHGAAPGGSYPTQNYGGGAVGTYASIGLAAADAVKQAVSKLQPAKVGYSTGRAYYNVNRDAFNELTGRWTQASNLTGPVDREVEVLSFLNMENLPIASYTTLFSQQASGDVNPLFRRVGTNNLASMNLLPITGFELTQEPVEEPIRDRLIPLSRPDTTYARQLFGQLTALGIMMGEEVIRIMSLTKDYDSNPTIWSKQQNATCPGRKRIDRAREGVPGVYTNASDVSIITGVLGLGDIVLASVGAEIFTKIGLRIKAESTMNKTMLVTMTNGKAASGYVPDAGSWDHETFQVLGSNLQPGSCPEVTIAGTLSSLISQYRSTK